VRLARPARDWLVIFLPGRDPDHLERIPHPVAIHIGTSGWSYDHWAGIVYPRGASGLRRLDAYVGRFATVEVNNTFYRWPKDEVFATWRERTPDDFVFSIKASRGLTQFRKLNDPVPWLERMDAGLRNLGDKMGVLVFQLPPHFPYNPDRLAHFLEVAPSWPRLSIEFRHPSWHREETFAMLEAHEVAYCVMSGANLPCILRATAPFVYVRLHGPDPGRLYGGSYSDADLRWWADRIREWADQGRDIYAYFNNDGHGHAVHNAEGLRALISSR
jgi:uncharacterized protein YecE (DUF72 family)